MRSRVESLRLQATGNGSGTGMRRNEHRESRQRHAENDDSGCTRYFLTARRRGRSSS